MSSYQRCYAEISLEAIGRNMEEIRKKAGEGVKTLAVIKADAYGHGAVRVGKYLEGRADFFAVATLEEALELKENGIQTPVLILGYTSPKQFRELVSYDIRPAVYNFQEACLLNEEAEKQQKKACIHLAVDTGMTRIGFQATEKDADEAARIAALPNVVIEGMFSHFSCADQKDKKYCISQLDKFDRMYQMLCERGVKIPIRHICNSAGIMEFDRYRYDMVRAGIILYGIYPSEEVQKENLSLIPALQWKAHVIHVKDVGPGVGVSYGATYTTSRPVTRIATVSAGYADGYPRALSSRGRVLIHGEYAQILGRICMDQMMVDVTDIPDVKVEDIVTLVGYDGKKHIPIEEVADPAGRFNYEMLCDISERVVRVYDTDQKDRVC